ncbi:MAG: phosphatidate cytidylyltransferase [Thermoleophilia bacterium]|nr:phosphatidate cytidylyltransferase [Thermoleophilia bacterium]MCZ4496641.1 phosphatidate cytidylyltransferase [Thermoleophilia bacterium]
MKSRLIVAAIGVPILYLVLLSGFSEHIAWAVSVSVALGIAALELCTMLRRMGPFVPAAFLPVALAPLFAWRLSEVGIFLAMLAVVPLIMVFQGLSNDREDPLGAVLATLAPVVYLAPAAGLVVILRQAEAGFDLTLLLIASVFLNDTGAYFVGRAIGRHKLSPRISPNKSVEGFVGGVLIGTFVMWYGHFLVETGGEHVLTGWEALGIGVAVALVTPMGDLFESLLKRSAGVKDSGSLLGEHGGVLDRVDALMMAIPVMYVGCFFAGAL